MEERENKMITANVNRASLRLYRPGLTWLVQHMLMSDSPKSHEDIAQLIEGYSDLATNILKASPLLKGIDLDTKEGVEKAFELIAPHEGSVEWWAYLINAYIGLLEESLENNDVKKAAWACNRATNARAMLLFKLNLENLAWKGYRLNQLRKVLEIWVSNKENSEEEFWQKIIVENSFILSQIFSFPVLILKDKAYIGGKGIDNSGGKVIDFLLQNNLTENTALLEIKTPNTRILGAEYRDGVYNVSAELNGAIMQALQYKDTYLKEFHELKSKSGEHFDAFNPQVVVLIGSIEKELTDPEKRRSFELYRNSMKDVTILTFDELFKKVELLLSIAGDTTEER